MPPPPLCRRRLAAAAKLPPPRHRQAAAPVALSAATALPPPLRHRQAAAVKLPPPSCRVPKSSPRENDSIPFADWCKTLEPFMQAADSFNLITQSQEIDEYTLLPALWQAMSPVDKKTAATIVQSFTHNAWVLIVAVH
jgi:hypothetical protein